MPDISYIDISGYVVTAVSDYSLWTSPNITKLANMFKDCSSFVGIGLPLWKTSNVTDMSGMFSGCTHFNQDLSGWITSNVTTMARMFKDDISFNGNIGKWNTSKVTDMSGMFSGCTTFNRDISGWDISGLMNAANMLDTTNLSVITYTNLLIGWGSRSIIQSGVTLGAVGMSYYVDKYKVNKLQNTYSWTIGGTPTHVVPFYLSSSTNWSNAYLDGSGNAIYPSISGDSIVATSDFSLWNPSGVTNMSGMFKNCSSFTGIGLNTSYWNNDISSVTDMSGMFAGCTNFNQDISGWITSNVTTMARMFNDDINFNKNIGNWNTSKVTDMSGMFSGCTAFNQDLSGWDISGLTDATNMLNGCGMSSQNYSNLLIGWALNTPYIRPNVPFGSSNLQYFPSAGASRYILTSAPYNWTITDAGIGCPPSIAVLTDWSSMFVGGVGSTTNTLYVDVSGYLIIATTSFSNWDPSMVTNFQSIFSGCASFVGIGVPLWKTTSAVNTSLMFNGCTNFNQDLSGWNTSNVTNMSGMFGSCSLFNKDLSWNTSNVTNMNNMFKSATSFNGNINNWNTSKVTDMGGMFQNDAIFNGNIGNWNISKVTTMSGMFNGCTAFNQDLSGWDISGLTDATNMLNGCGMSSQNYSNLLIGWALNTPYIRPNVPFGSSNLQYFPSAGASRDILTSAPYNWTITDAGVACPPSIAALTSWANMFVGGVGSTTIPAYVDVSGYVITALTNFNSWDPSMVTNFNSMFKNSTIFTGAGLSSWNTSNVTDMSGMFSGCTNFNQTLSSWNTSKVTTMSSMFLNATAFNQDISAWDISGLTSATNMLDGTAMSVINLTSLLVGWGSRPIIQPSHVLGASGRSYYVNKYNVNKLLSAPNNWTTTATTTNVVPFYLSGSTSWYNLYPDGTGNASYPAIAGDTINQYSDFSLWNPASVTTMSSMFQNCSSFTGIGLDTANWNNNLGSASNMSWMFAGCTSFTGNTISAWNTSGTNDMGRMFYGCALFNPNLSSWNTSSVSNMGYMFYGCSSFNQNLNSWNTSSVMGMGFMFYGCSSFNQTLSSWNTTNVMYMDYMFNGCSSFTGAGLSSWTIASLNNAANMLNGTLLSAQTLSRMLINWGAQATIISSVSLGCAGLSYYPRPETDSLKINKYWTYDGITSLNNFYHNYASGVTWTSIAMSPDGTNLAALQPDTNSSTPGTYVIYSTNSGSNWSVTDTAIAYGGGSSITYGDNFYYCGGNGSPGYTGYIYSSPTGATLTQLAGQPYGSAQKYMGITSSSDGLNIAVAIIADSAFNFTAKINYSLNSGATWTEGNTSSYWVAIAGNNTNEYICAIGRQTNGGNYTGSIYISSNYGANWTLVPTTIKYWSAITFAALSTPGANIVYACIGLLATAGDTNTGQTGQIWESTALGNTWAVLSSSPTLCWTSIACSSNGSTVVAGDTSNGVYVSINSGISWVQILTISGVSAVSCDYSGSFISVCVNNSGIWTYIQIS